MRRDALKKIPFARQERDFGKAIRLLERAPRNAFFRLIPLEIGSPPPENVPERIVLQGCCPRSFFGGNRVALGPAS